MRSKVDSLYSSAQQLRRHYETDIIRYYDQLALSDDIQRVDEIYLWYAKLREQAAEE